MQSVSQAIGETGEAALELQTSSEDLQSQSGSLKREVGLFLEQARGP